MARSREPLFLVVAMLVHAAGFLGASAIVRRTSPLDHAPSYPAHREPAETRSSQADYTEVDLLPDEPKSPPNTAISAQLDITNTMREPALRPGYAEPRRREREPAQTRPEPVPDVGPAPAESSPAPARGMETGWLPNEEPEAGRAPGLNGPPVWAIPGALTAPSAAGTKPLAPRASSAHQAAPKARNPSEEQKQAALFPAAGTLGSAVSEEVASSSTPLVSESRFKLTLDAQGRLVSAMFLSANEGDRAAWERVARAVTKRFAGKSMPLPSAFAGGGTVYVTVSSRVTMPDGTAHGTPALRSITERAPDNEYGRIESPLSDRFRSPMTGTGPAPNKITVGAPFVFDVSNVGGTRRRVVRAQVQAVPRAVPAAPGK